jgi:two-component system, OmpR family, sensor histidine kinase SenX3
MFPAAMGGSIRHHSAGLAKPPAADQSGTLVTELIALSRPQGRRAAPELATVEVDEVVHEALDRCRLAAESVNIRITVDAPSGLLLKGDTTLLVTALSNLLDNAVSYSPSGSPVSVSRRLKNGLRRSPSPTAAWASPSSTRNRCSSGSSASTKRAAAPPGAPGWGWRSSNTSPPTTAGTSRSGAGLPPAPPSPYESLPIQPAHNTRHAPPRHPRTRQDPSERLPRLIPPR